VAPVTVSAIVVNYRRPDILGACLRSLGDALARSGVQTELVVVDNASGDRSLDVVAEVAPDAIVVEMATNVGFASAVNQGVRRSAGEWVLLINNDVELEPDAVEHLLAAARTAPGVGSLAAQMRFASDTGIINSAGIGVDRLGVAFDRLLGQPAETSETQPCEVFGASGGAAMLRRTMLDGLGGFDDRFFFLLEDVDLAWRAQMRGWRCLYVPAAVVYHHHGATMSHGSSRKYYLVGLNRVRLLAKNADAAQLRRYGLAMIGYDLAYIGFTAVTDRTLAPLRGRLRGLREWRTYRRSGAVRRPVELAPARGTREALARRAAWLRSSAAHTT
jgi:GT2 family glycosyltransferase